MDAWPWKRPEDSDSFGFDWTDKLDGESISTVTWSVPSGLTKLSETTTGAVTSALISGGAAGAVYDVSCTITTATRTLKLAAELRVTNF